MLRAIPVKTPAQVQRLRVLRNMTRHGFSFDQSEISEAQQTDWWASMTGRVQAWLYATSDHGVIVGFGVLRQTDDGRWWTSVGVDPDFAGHGYGKQITHDLVERSPEPPYGVARKDNPAGVKLHAEQDWDEVDGPDSRLRYFHARRVWPGSEALEQWAEHGWV